MCRGKSTYWRLIRNWHGNGITFWTPWEKEPTVWFVQAYAVAPDNMIDNMLMWSLLFPWNPLLSWSCRLAYLHWTCVKVNMPHRISSKDTCMYTLFHSFSLPTKKHHHAGLLFNQSTYFKGCIIIHVSLCGWATCSKVSLYVCVLLVVCLCTFFPAFVHLLDTRIIFLFTT